MLYSCTYMATVGVKGYNAMNNTELYLVLIKFEIYFWKKKHKSASVSAVQ